MSLARFILLMTLTIITLLSLILVRAPGHLAEATAHPPGCAESNNHQELTPLSGKDAIFSKDQVHSFTLCLTTADWDYLSANALDKRFRPAKLFVNGKWIGHVGLRYKGFNSLKDCFADGIQVCPKTSMKIKFDKYDRRLQLGGLKNLHFNSMVNDPTLMHDQLAYHLFREMNVPAPRTGYARLVINGQDLGLFATVEQIDDRFIKDRFPDQVQGNLYKELWPTNGNKQAILTSLKTNRKKPSVQALLDFSLALHNAPEEDLPQVAARWMDIEETMRYLAVDQAIANWDGITTLYCDANNNCGSHNFYLYEDNNHHFTLLPWDMEVTFDTETHLEDVPNWNDKPDNCEQQYTDDLVQAPACDLLIRALALTNQRLYQDALALLAEGPFRLPALNDYIDELAGLIAPEVATDPHGPSVADWEKSVTAFRNDLVILRERLEVLASGHHPSNAWLAQSSLNDWESVRAEEVALGLTTHAPSATTIKHQLNETRALSGSRDLLVNFEFRNDQYPWQQWGTLRLPFVDEDRNLDTVKEIRLKMRSDQPRPVSISLDSDLYTNKDAGAFYGWEVTVSSKSSLVILTLDQVSLPEWAPSVPETLTDIKGATTALRIAPLAIGVDQSTGFFPTGVTDKGFLQIDVIEFVHR